MALDVVQRVEACFNRKVRQVLERYAPHGTQTMNEIIYLRESPPNPNGLNTLK